MFAMYALTYTLPSLGSFMVEGYHNTTVADHDPSAPRPKPPAQTPWLPHAFWAFGYANSNSC